MRALPTYCPFAAGTACAHVILPAAAAATTAAIITAATTAFTAASSAATTSSVAIAKASISGARSHAFGCAAAADAAFPSSDGGDAAARAAAAQRKNFTGPAAAATKGAAAVRGRGWAGLCGERVEHGGELGLHPPHRRIHPGPQLRHLVRGLRLPGPQCPQLHLKPG
jgi:hypothetical protein